MLSVSAEHPSGGLPPQLLALLLPIKYVIVKDLPHSSVWLPLIFEAHIFLPRETHLQWNDRRKWKKKNLFYRHSFYRHCFRDMVGLKAALLREWSRDHWHQNHQESYTHAESHIPRKTYRIRISGAGPEKCVFKKSHRGSYVYSEAHRTLHQEIQAAGEHALILLLKLQAARPQVLDTPARAI